MHNFNLAAFHAAPLVREPFEYLVVDDFVLPDARAAIKVDYPNIDQSGSFPLANLTYGPAFKSFVDDLEGPDFRAAFEEKFHLDLAGRPTTITVRGRCSDHDGKIHTDSKSKIITVLIYMNPNWGDSGGRLRLLRSENIDDVLIEVPPKDGTLIAFKRSHNSYHGHKRYNGPRRVIQFNWVTNEGSQKLALLRHRISASVKRIMSILRPSRRPAPRASDDNY
jgi:hypothetical protein